MSKRRPHRRRSFAKTVAFSIWMAAVALYLLWEATHYRGVMSLLGEWQFNALGRHYPTFNYILLVALLWLPGYLVFLRPRKRDGTERLEAVLLRSSHAFQNALWGSAAGLAVAALVVLVVMLFLPREGPPIQRIDLARPSISLPREGPTLLSGMVVYERTAGFDRDLLLTSRTYRFAPVIGGQESGPDLQYFVQFRPVDAQTRAGTSLMTGVLKRNGLPGEVIRLFRYAGYRLEQPHYVLYEEAAALRWPYLITAIQLAIAALLAVAVALLQLRRVRRADRLIHHRHDG